MQRHCFPALALAATGLLAFSTPAAGQESTQSPPRVEADSGRRMFDPAGRLLEARQELGITNEQAARLEAIRSKFLATNQSRIDTLRREYMAKDSARKADDKLKASRRALRASMDTARTEVMAVLTPEQQTKLAELRRGWRKEWREDRHGRKHGHGGHEDDGHGHD